jgi:hypothetical protein
MTDHTPTPWKLIGDYIIDADGFCVAQLLPKHKIGDKPANAAFFVRAVNAHVELVRLLTEQLSDYEALDQFRITPTDKAWMDRARKAIAKAEGK